MNYNLTALCTVLRKMLKMDWAKYKSCSCKHLTIFLTMKHENTF